MAFSRDGYKNALEGSDPEEYYEERFDSRGSLWRDAIGWEARHCESAPNTDKLSMFSFLSLIEQD